MPEFIQQWILLFLGSWINTLETTGISGNSFDDWLYWFKISYVFQIWHMAFSYSVAVDNHS